MTSERLERIQQLFNEALALPEPQRNSFLIQTCGCDQDLLAEVNSLLSHSESTETSIAGVRIRSRSQAETVPTSKAESSKFQPNRVLANRYRIVRFIGRGGMGEVYEAHDMELRERVALKTILPAIASEKTALERFKREIQLARKVTSPHVCRIFDLAYHVARGQEEVNSPEDVTTFLTMELLEGETLRQRLRRETRITPTEALPLAAQMAAGLNAAHKAGVVHRDFKAANVMIVPSRDYEEGTRVVITDFGLARQNTAESSLAMVSLTGEALGTPAYMAPEQVRGETATTASDIYAFGIVLFEMVTGTLPFTGDLPVAIAVKRLEQPPPSPRAYVPDLDSKFERAILRCLALNPADRFPTALDVVRAIAGEEVSLPKPVKRLAERKRFRYISAGIAAALVIALGIGYRAYVTRETVNAPRTVAVFDFKNTAGLETEAWLSQNISTILANDLSVGGQLAVIPTRDVVQAAQDLHISDVESLSVQTLSSIKRRLNADYVVTGSYLALGKQSGGQVRVEARLLDTLSGRLYAAVDAVGTERDIFQLLGRPSDRLREELGVAPLSSSEASNVFASIPADPIAARLYSNGLKKLNSFDTLGAIPLLQQAITAAPKYALIHADLAEAWAELGYDAKARDEAQRAFDLSGHLSPEKSALVEGRYREMTHEWDKAIEIYRVWWNRFPNQPVFGLRLAEAQIEAGKGKEALSTLDAVRKMQSNLSPDAHIAMQQAKAYEILADFQAEYDAAGKAADFARQSGAQLLLAHARIMQCWASRNLGHPKEAMNACEEAKRINESLGNRAGIALSINNLAHTLADQGDIAGARGLYEKALMITQEIGDKYDMQGAMNNLANMLFRQGDMGGAKRLYQDGLAVARERGNNAQIATLLGNIASVDHSRGNLSAAENGYQQALSVAREVGDRAELARALYNLGMVLAKRGDLEGAMNRYEEALEIRNMLGLKSEVAQTRVSMGDILLTRGDLEGAGNSYEDALKLQTELGEKNDAAYTNLSLAQVMLERKRVAGAEAAFRQVAGDFHSQKDDDDEALAKAGLGRVLLLENRIDDAKREIHEASELGGKSPDVTVRLTISIASARLNSALGKYSDATKNLQSALAEASKIGLVGFQFETRLALGELEMMSGKETSSRALLNVLQQEATPKGYSLIAKRASSLLAGAKAQLQP